MPVSNATAAIPAIVVAVLILFVPRFTGHAGIKTRTDCVAELKLLWRRLAVIAGGPMILRNQTSKRTFLITIGLPARVDLLPSSSRNRWRHGARAIVLQAARWRG
jgi:hypothetical protein